MKLTKTILYDLIVRRVSENTLGYVFLKNNARHYYYFRRQSPYPKAEDMLIVSAYFRNGYLVCSQASVINKSRYYYGSLINRWKMLSNSATKQEVALGSSYYYFDHTPDSLALALDRLLMDLDSAGREFILYSDRRYLHPKFVHSMAFIDSLKMSGAEVEALLFAMRSRGDSGNETVRALQTLFDTIDTYDDSDPAMKNRWSNIYFVIEVLEHYLADVRERENPGRRR